MEFTHFMDNGRQHIVWWEGGDELEAKHLPNVGMEHLIPLAHYLTLINLSHCQSKAKQVLICLLSFL